MMDIMCIMDLWDNSGWFISVFLLVDRDEWGTQAEYLQDRVADQTPACLSLEEWRRKEGWRLGRDDRGIGKANPKEEHEEPSGGNLENFDEGWDGSWIFSWPTSPTAQLILRSPPQLQVKTRTKASLPSLQAILPENDEVIPPPGLQAQLTVAQAERL